MDLRYCLVQLLGLVSLKSIHQVSRMEAQAEVNSVLRQNIFYPGNLFFIFKAFNRWGKAHPQYQG